MKHILLTAASMLSACAATVSPNPATSTAGIAAIRTADWRSLDDRIRALMKRDNVPGLAIAVVDHGHIRHIRSFGHANVEKQVPLKTDTIMYAASITKAAFAYMVLQLVDEGRLDLDRPISTYLSKPLPEYVTGSQDWSSLKGDGQWRELTPRILLSHSSGLANLRWLEPDMDMKFHFAPGQAYAYSGEGYYLLQFVLEEGLGLDVKNEMQRRIFDRFGMPNTSMQWREDFASHLADGYTANGSFVPHDARDNVSASGSMDTTIADQARMWAGMMMGKGLSTEMRAEWVRPQLPISTKMKFPTTQAVGTYDPRGPAIKLAAGLGVETWQGPAGHYFAKGGHNDSTGNIVICQDAKRRCVVLLSNSVRAEMIYPEIVEAALGETRYPWWWTYSELFGASNK